MKRFRLFFVIGIFASAAGCESRVPPDDPGSGSREGLAAHLKAQLSIDGGVNTMVADAGIPPTITETVTATQTATATATATGTVPATVTNTSTVTVTSTATSVHTLTHNTTVTVTGTNTTSSTGTQTATATSTATGTQTYTATATATGTQTLTTTTTVTNTVTNTVTKTVTNTTTSTATQTATGSSTLTKTQTATGSKSYTATGTLTLTFTGTKTGTQTSSGAVSGTKTATGTATWTGSYLGTGTGTGTRTLTGTLTGTATVTGHLTLTSTGTTTHTGSTTATASATASASGTTTQTYTVVPTVTVTNSATSTGTTTSTATSTVTATATHTSTATGTIKTSTLTRTVTNTTTRTITTTVTNTGTATNSHTATGTGTYTQVQTDTNSGTQTQTATATGTKTAVLTSTVTNTNTATNTLTIANPCVGTWAFCDNFENGTGAWTVRQGPVQNFSPASDGTKVYSQSDSSASTLYISQAGSAWMDSTIEASLKPIAFSSNTASAAVTLWGHYDSTWGADCGYYVALRGDGKVALGKRVAGVDSMLGTPVSLSGGINAGTWYDVKLEMIGTTINAYVGGTRLLTQADTSCDGGSTGVGSVGASFEADNVQVTAPSTNACVQNWRTATCGAFCTYEKTVQNDRAGCDVYLDCYVAHGCSPETCGGPDDVCGVNKLNPWGTASKEVADQVYKCMGCRGSVDCSNAKYYNGTTCADGNPCTFGDTCQNKVCTPDPNRATQCSASDQCHNAGTCDITTGQCSNPAKGDGTSCDDGNACTQTDSCQNGTCTGTNPVTCTASDQCHLGVCDPASGACTNPQAPDGTACNDGNGCTQVDSCISGVCTGSNPVVCPTPPQCQVAVCDSTSGMCSNSPVSNGTSCTSSCSSNATCQAGECVAPQPAQPTGLVATPGSGLAALTWAAYSAATGYNVKRATTTGGPYTTVATVSDPSFTDVGLTCGVTYYYVVSALGACGESLDSGEVSSTCAASLSPTTSHPLPAPPHEVGCYVYTPNGWVSMPCLDKQWVKDHVPPPDFFAPANIAQPATATSQYPLVFGRIDTSFRTVGSVIDVDQGQWTNPDAGVHTGPPDTWSIQNNTNKFTASDGHGAWVQFTVQVTNGTAALCLWELNLSTGDFFTNTLCTPGWNGSAGIPNPGHLVPLRNQGKIQPLDFVNVAGYADTSTPSAPKLGMVVELSMVDDSAHYQYAVVSPDVDGLTGRWGEISGGVFGEGGCSSAEFTNAQVWSRLMTSNCVGDTSPESGVTCGSSSALQGVVGFSTDWSLTCENTNLTYVNCPSIGVNAPTWPGSNGTSVNFPNPNFASVNYVLADPANTSTMPPSQAFVKDNSNDHGQVPSNLGNQAFWESPDIFLVNSGDPVDLNAEPSDTSVMPNGDYDLWVRVNNEFGCTQVTGVKALVSLADPTVGLTIWSQVTNGEYWGNSTQMENGNITVPAGGRALLGPFLWHAPDNYSGSGHKCILAAIKSDSQAAPSDPTDAPNSNQVAQRNIQIDSCDFGLTNATTSAATVRLTLTASPPEVILGLTGEDNVSVSIDDADGSWYSTWYSQLSADGGVIDTNSFTVLHAGDKTTVRMGSHSVVLNEVSLPAGTSRSVSAVPVAKNTAPYSIQAALGMQAEITYTPEDASQKQVDNGGSCNFTAQGTPVNPP